MGFLRQSRAAVCFVVVSLSSAKPETTAKWSLAELKEPKNRATPYILHDFTLVMCVDVVRSRFARLFAILTVLKELVEFHNLLSGNDQNFFKFRVDELSQTTTKHRPMYVEMFSKYLECLVEEYLLRHDVASLERMRDELRETIVRLANQLAPLIEKNER